MKKIDVKSMQFVSLKEVYDFLDKHAVILLRNWDLDRAWYRFRKLTDNEKEKQIATWEATVLQFNFSGENLFPNVFAYSEESKQVLSYPELKKEDKDFVEYVKKRAKNAKNPLLIARYNHVLWKSIKGIKHKDYAQAAISGYLKTISELYAQVNQENGKDALIELSNIYSTLLAICSEVGLKDPICNELTNRLLFEMDDINYSTKVSILEDMLDHPKLFKPKDFENTLSIFEDKLKKENGKGDDYMLAEFQLPIAVKIAQKTKSDIAFWQNETGKAYLRLADLETDDKRLMIKLNHLSDAAGAFAKAKNAESRKSAQDQYSKLKQKFNLNTVSIPIDEDQKKLYKAHDKFLQTVTDEMLKLPPEEIYLSIAKGYLFPSYEELKKKGKSELNAFLESVTRIDFDINKNILEDDSLSDEDKRILESFDRRIQISLYPYLHRLIIGGIESGRLTAFNFIKYLQNQSWMGLPRSKVEMGGQTIETDWIGLLAPSLLEFFSQIQAWKNSKHFTPSFVLCIDSLTLKMEGLFRDFSTRAGISTSFKNDKGMRESHLNQLLGNPEIRKFFNEDDMLFFKYLFVNNPGRNIRNNVAHCYYEYYDYDLFKMLLLIAALLRFSKFEYNKG